MKRIIVAYSGSLAVSRMVSNLAHGSADEIVTATVDVGQDAELADVRERALALGARRAHVIDAREAFARDFVVPAIQAGALQDGRYPLTDALERAVVAQRVVDLARMEDTGTIVFASARSDEAERFRTLVRTLDASAELLQLGDASPVGTLSRGESERFRTYQNMWGRVAIHSTAPPPDELEEWFARTRAIADCPGEPASVAIEFDTGVPIRINGVDMMLLDLIESLEMIAGLHGVGRMQQSDPATGTVRSHEAPAAVVLHAAYEALERVAVGDRIVERRRALSRACGDLLASGAWFDPARLEIVVQIAKLVPPVTGSVRLELFRGECKVSGCDVPAGAGEDRHRATVG